MRQHLTEHMHRAGRVKKDKKKNKDLCKIRQETKKTVA